MSNSLISYHLSDIWIQIRKLQICYSPTKNQTESGDDLDTICAKQSQLLHRESWILVWIPKECNTMWGIWPWSSQGPNRVGCIQIPPGVQRWTSGPWWSSYLPEDKRSCCIHTLKLWISTLTHKCDIPTLTVAKADRQNQGSGTTAHSLRAVHACSLTCITNTLHNIWRT